MDDITASDLDLEHLPPELLLDPTHPATDPYLKNVEMTKRRIVAQCGAMYPMYVAAVKLRVQGRNYTEIAAQLDTSAPNVSRIIKRPDAQRLAALLQYLALTMDGPRQVQRDAMTWRIAVKNEDKDPSVSLRAIGELNRVEHAEKVLEAGVAGAGTGTVQIVINNETLPRGALDQ